MINKCNVNPTVVYKLGENKWQIYLETKISPVSVDESVSRYFNVQLKFRFRVKVEDSASKVMPREFTQNVMNVQIQD